MNEGAYLRDVSARCFCKPVKAGLQKASCRQRSAAVQRAHVLDVVHHDVGNEVLRRIYSHELGAERRYKEEKVKA